MGNRAQVQFIDENRNEVWFYTHWTGHRLEQTVINAMRRGKGRHNDPEYLARIIFSEMIKDEVMDEVGYGIGFQQHGDVDKVVIVDCNLKTVTMYDGTEYPFKSFLT